MTSVYYHVSLLSREIFPNSLFTNSCPFCPDICQTASPHSTASMINYLPCDANALLNCHAQYVID